MAKNKKSVKKGTKKSVKKVAKKPMKKAVKPARPGKPAKKLVKPARPGKPVKKVVKKSVKKAVKKLVAKKAVAKPARPGKSIALAPKAPERSLLGGNELPEGETRRVIAAVKDAILRNTEDHPFFDSSDDKSVVIVSKEIEFVDTQKGVYMIPRGVTISIIKGDMGATWGIERHTD